MDVSYKSDQVTIGPLSMDDPAYKKSKGIYCTKCALICAILFAVILCVSVGVFCYIKGPGKPCDIIDEESVTDANQETTTEEDNIDPMPWVTNLRLNRTIIPYHYDIELQSHIPLFEGNVRIYANVTENTNQITLHKHQTLNITNLKVVRNNLNIKIQEYMFDGSRQLFNIFLEEELTEGDEIEIYAELAGTHVHEDLLGFYRSSYEEDNTRKYLVVTQFQRTGARRAFLCFDEPSFKATYNVTLVRNSTLTSLSNMQIERTETRDDGWEADIYEKTMVMPTYLLAFVVSEFKSKELTTKDGLLVRIWSRPNFIDQVDYALHITGAIVSTFAKYLEFPSELKKIDQIAIPDFDAGAMENWGLVTYREKYLLWNPSFSTTQNKRSIAAIIGHEISHFWFGNLVTCEWWDNTWLNEGFANHMADWVVGEVEPSWEMEQFYMSAKVSIMEKDSTKTSQPIYLEGIEHHADLKQAFDQITYRKGGHVIRMMKYFLSPETFQKALQKYMKEYQYANVVKEDLYSYLEKQAEDDGKVSWDPIKRNFSDIMDTWITQMNFPVITVQRDVNTGVYKLKKERFLYEDTDNKTDKYPSPYGEFMWDVPITYKVVGQDTSELRWFYKDDEEFVIEEDELLFINTEQQGFYRVNYDEKHFQDIMEKLKTDHEALSAIERGMFINDVNSMAHADYVSAIRALEVLEYMGSERDFLPWYVALYGALWYIEDLFYFTKSYEYLQKFLMPLITDAYDAMSWDENSFDDHLKNYTQAAIITKACQCKYYACVDVGRAYFKTMMDTDNYTFIRPDIRAQVYCTGIAHGGLFEQEYLFNRWLNLFVTKDNLITEYHAQEETSLLRGLGCTTEPWLIQRLLSKLNESVDHSSYDYAIGQLAGNAESIYVMWDYIDQNFDNIKPSLIRSVLYYTKFYFGGQEHLDMVNDFIERHPSTGIDMSYKSCLSTITKNIEWMEKNHEAVHDWLVSKTS